MSARELESVASPTDPNRSLIPFRLAVFVLYASAILAIAAPAATAQDSAGATGKDSSAEQPADAQPTSVPLAEVPAVSRETEERLRSIAAKLSPDPAVDRVVTEQKAERTGLADANEALGVLLKTGPTRARLADANSEWKTSARGLERSQNVLAVRTTDLGQAIEYLRQHEALWSRTREIAVDSAASAGVIQIIDSVLENVRQIIKSAKPELNAVLRIQGELSQDEATIAQAIERIDVARGEYRSRLFDRDLTPLGAEADDEVAVQFADARDSILSEASAVRDFVVQRATAVMLFGLMLVILIYTAYVLRKNVRDATEHVPGLESAISLFERPISLAILGSVIIFRIFDPGAPKAVRDLQLMLLLVPVLRILPPLVPRTFRPLLYGTAIFFTVTQIRTLIHQAPQVGRVFFLVEILAAIVFLIWVQRPARLAQLEPGQRIQPFLHQLLRAALAILSVAFAASAIGFQSFAGLLGDGVLTSGYIAVLLFGAVLSGEAILRVSLQTGRPSKLRSVRRRRREIIQWSLWLMRLIAVLAWIRATLEAFSILTAVYDFLTALLDASLSIGALSISLRDILAFAITLLAAWGFSRVVRFFLEEEVFTRISMKRGAPNAIATLLHYTLLTLGFLMALGAAGMDFSRVTLLAGAFGVGVGFGLQNIVNNFVSGLVLLFERPIQTGDTVEVGDVLGDVKRIGIRSSTIRTVAGAEVIVPNANLISDEVTNWTLSDRRRRIELDVGVAYGTDAERVLALLLEVARENDNVIADPEPRALFMGFGDSSLDFRLRAWVPDFERGMWTRSDLAVAIQRALKDANIAVPFPQRDLHLRSVEPEVERILGPGDGDR